ncbi:MAG: hypothetical protein ACXAC7_00335 [Candidatus Hodarchaeales archaeon]
MVLKFCPVCFSSYVPIHNSKFEAFKSKNLVSKEQWLSGCCSSACWDSLFSEFSDKSLEESVT